MNSDRASGTAAGISSTRSAQRCERNGRHAADRDRALRALNVSKITGSSETTITPMITSPKFSFTMGVLPKK
jgi:hypothetical protein